MIIVLTTGGKNEDFYKVRIDLFDNLKEAEKHIEEVNKDKGNKYWYKAEIVENGKYYEPDQFELYSSEY